MFWSLITLIQWDLSDYGRLMTVVQWLLFDDNKRTLPPLSHDL